MVLEKLAVAQLVKKKPTYEIWGSRSCENLDFDFPGYGAVLSCLRLITFRMRLQSPYHLHTKGKDEDGRLLSHVEMLYNFEGLNRDSSQFEEPGVWLSCLQDLIIDSYFERDESSPQTHIKIRMWILILSSELRPKSPQGVFYLQVFRPKLCTHLERSFFHASYITRSSLPPYKASHYKIFNVFVIASS